MIYVVLFVSYRNDIRVSVIGKRDSISDSLLDMITKMEETTKNNKSLHIIEAIDYTGRGEIIQACVALAGKVKDGVIQPEDIDENVFQQELETKCSEFPDPDIMIRTGGKYSIDNFMIWQMAYTELYFVEKDDLEFNKTSFVEALDSYQKRSRRFGGK
ncbi:putative ditrans,polycis-polyprenyl diphosphate synthase ((2E,6E)-farnesyl diphosphate specific) [Helianthus annuus]|nr:putative ditrans,polycis-polyprenyl diphosphate synthase ((2E,6E)-farnesyl diphosphate specific) [Helianthus annuus]KAJ0448786.1 putative ditrans,polycis-polyprenyl diphosphate synthase ((2E,6E)-farnesyl diphosphate specific) [Helianthus annuus]KAJ0633661.1 putative ditrans,polycis-polyprenyl diphosphate synthase ((2E,6E)-farnesyl diphosphate specific) [Helianthus annuus]KAJ0637481.1 putative ditrans,polycis-polyprenyl diphosphate synthase ((2E,6E)-farnesyl diphosphate specific) [Helianthus a